MPLQDQSNNFSMTYQPEKDKQSGQAIVEYILLLAIVVIISTLFVRGASRGLAQIWLYSANKVSYPTKIQIR